MDKDATGKRILREKPRISSNSVDLKLLQALPENTFGRRYVNMLNKYVSIEVNTMQLDC